MTATVEKKPTLVTQPVKAKDVVKDKVVATPIVPLESTPAAGPEKIAQAVKAAKDVADKLAELSADPKLVDNMLKVGDGAMVTYIPVASADEVPTDRQIKNAERVLRAAGRDTDTAVAVAVARVLDGGKGGGTVTIDGVAQTPVATDIVVTNAHVSLPDHDISLYVPYRLAGKCVGKFSLYKVKHDGGDVTYLIDENSCVEIQNNQSQRRPFSRRSVSAGGILMLVNSYSKNDTVLGENYLVNIDSSNNLFNNSSVADLPEDKLNSKSLNLPWGFEEETSGRRPIANSFFKMSTITNSGLTSGTYVSCCINETTIDSAGHTVLNQCDLYTSSVRGSRAHMKGMTLDRSTLSSEGSVHCGPGRLVGIYINAPSIYLSNKMGYLSIETPTEKLDLVRSTETEFVVFGHWGGQQRIALDASREDIEVLACDVHLGRGYMQSHKPADVKRDAITQSIIDYIVDSIESRFSVVRLMDAAQRLAGGTTFADMYYPGDLYSV